MRSGWSSGRSAKVVGLPVDMLLQRVAGGLRRVKRRLPAPSGSAAPLIAEEEFGSPGARRAPSLRGMARGSSGQVWYKQYEAEGADSFRRHNPPTPFNWGRAGKTATCYFDLTVGDEALGRVELELLDQLLPVTVRNFKALCTGENPLGLCYRGTALHRIVKGSAVVGGDVEDLAGEGSHSGLTAADLADLAGAAAAGGGGGGGGAEAVAAAAAAGGGGGGGAGGVVGAGGGGGGDRPVRHFADEALLLPHTHEGIVSMVNGGVHTNGSQFYITTAPAPHLDGYSVAFGRVVKGMELLHKAAKTFSIRGRPVEPIVIAACGVEE